MFNDKSPVRNAGLSQLFIYSREGLHLSSITTKDNDLLHDVKWTPRGNIVYTIYSNKVVVMSESSKINSAHTLMTTPRRLSVIYDGIVCVAVWKTGVYQSTDDSVNWDLVFKSANGCHCWRVIKVATEHNEDFLDTGEEQ